MCFAQTSKKLAAGPRSGAGERGEGEEHTGEDTAGLKKSSAGKGMSLQEESPDTEVRNSSEQKEKPVMDTHLFFCCLLCPHSPRECLSPPGVQGKALPAPL